MFLKLYCSFYFMLYKIAIYSSIFEPIKNRMIKTSIIYWIIYYILFSIEYITDLLMNFVDGFDNVIIHEDWWTIIWTATRLMYHTKLFQIVQQDWNIINIIITISIINPSKHIKLLIISINSKSIIEEHLN